MILGMPAFTAVHVIISLAEIVAGVFLLIAIFRQRQPSVWSGWFMVLAAATSITGFLLPASGLKPSQVVGLLSLCVLLLAWFAMYSRKLQGAWRSIYGASVVFVLYLDVFVAAVQSFQKISVLKALAPTGGGPVFATAQLLLLALAIGCGVAVVRRRSHAN
jgi:hypothetical protein